MLWLLRLWSFFDVFLHETMKATDAFCAELRDISGSMMIWWVCLWFSYVGLLRGRLFMGASNSLRLKRQVLDVRHLNTSRSSRVQLVERWARNILMVRILPAKVLKLSAGKEIDCYSTNWNDPLFLDISWYFMIFLPNLQNNPTTQPQPQPPW